MKPSVSMSNPSVSASNSSIPVPQNKDQTEIHSRNSGPKSNSKSEPDNLEDNKIFEITANPTKILLPHILVKSSVSDIPLSLLIDSGSSISLIKYDSIQTHLTLVKEQVNLKGIDPGQESTRTMGHFNLKLQLLDSKQKPVIHKFHVVREIDIPYDGIIGSDMLNAFGCNIDYTNNTLRINNIRSKLLFHEPVYSIPPRTEMVIECSVSNPEIKEGIIQNQNLVKDLLVANCLVKVKKNNRVNLTVVNTTESPISVNSNMNLTLSPVEELQPYSNQQHQSYPVHKIQHQDSYHRTQEVLNQLRTSHLNSEEVDALYNLCSEYSDIFHLPGEMLTYTNALKHSIKTTSQNPIHAKSYRFPEIHKAEVKKQVDQMLSQGIIEPSDSPWSAPIWVVPKKLDSSGQRKWRVVIDYRQLNDITIGDTYPIPQINEILDQLGSSKYFSTLDLASGFHQIPMEEEDKAKTAFSVPEGHYQFTRMPFGLKNAPSTFQRLMNLTLSGLQGTRCFVYLDDIVLYGYDLDQAINNLRCVFQRLREHNLKLQPDKCEFLRREVAYLGHIITEQGVKPNPEKIEAVINFPRPTNPKHIKSFLGLVSYYRRFIPDFSKIAKPLTHLLKKEIPFVWQNQQQVAFDELKSKLTSAPVLIYPDFTKPFILTCDSSNYAIGSVLSQGPIGKERPIAYASRTLNKSECNYSTTEKELLAIIFGCKTFRPYLYGRKFQIVTDHRPLKWLFNHKDPSSKLQRWRLKLEEYEYEIVYRKGKLNSAADALSRYPPDLSNPVNAINTNDTRQEGDLPPSNPSADTDPIQQQLEDNQPTPSPLSVDLGSLSPIPFEHIDFDLPGPSSDLRIEEDIGNADNPDNVLNPAIPDDLPILNPLGDLNLSLPNSPFNPENVLNPTNSDNRYSPVNIPSPTTSDDSYSDYLKAMSNKNYKYNTIIHEYANKLPSSDSKVIIVPTSIDLDETNPYVEEILANNSDNSEFLNKERSLYSFLTLDSGDKRYYFLFTKVHHFDDVPYPDLFKTLQKLRNELLLQQESPSEISISDFKDPFVKISYSKLYNILAYLFHNTNITVKIHRNTLIYPTPSEIPTILKENHDLPIAGHVGSTRMLNRIKEKYSWKNMRTDIENYVKRCTQCQSNKALRQINRAPMQITSTSTAPFERISLDIVGPLPEAGRISLKYILTLQDDLTKFSVAYPISNITAEECLECLVHFISLFGIPRMILTDQGTNFTAELFKETCKFLKIKQIWSSPYHPQTQGALERSHSTIKEYLKSFVNENQTDWHKYIYTAILAYNTNVHCTTKFSPHELLFGQKPYFPNSLYEPSPSGTYHEYIKMLNHRLKLSREKALEYIAKSKERSKQYYDRHSRPVEYKVGDMVYVKNHARLRKALSPVWKGPYKVVKVHGNHTLSVLINRRHVKHHYDELKLATT